LTKIIGVFELTEIFRQCLVICGGKRRQNSKKINCDGFSRFSGGLKNRRKETGKKFQKEEFVVV
jgi:hypothetical protein